MDFFEHQDVARKNAGRLILLFLLAVASIGVVLYLLGVFLWAYLNRTPEGGMQFVWANPVALAFSAGVLIVVVGGGTLYKIVQLRSGGQVVARALGGRLVPRDTRDPGERQLLNIVEEMALASGTPVPPVYIMQGERGINAFAAGYAPESAVIGVTRGAVDYLTRGQMQGVIAHEFSHILNGDMRINIRLMGVLHGILLLGLVGGIMVRSLFYGSLLGSGSRSRSNVASSGNKGAGIVVFMVAGLVLVVLGAIGTFFGTWIKSAVSRQREYLADASAVQFTRDPSTISGALQAIGGFKHRSRLVAPNAAEASHMFFGQGLTSGFNNMFASHPPLPDRIRRVDPSWDGTFAPVGTPAFPELHGMESAQEREDRKKREKKSRDSQTLERMQSVLPGGNIIADPVALGTAIATIGTIDRAHVSHAQKLLASIPGPIREASSHPFSARAVVLGLLLDADSAIRAKQIEHLKEHSEPQVVRALAKILPAFDGLERGLRLPILDVTKPTLTQLTTDQARTFVDNARALAEADEKLDVFEWALLRLVEHRLAPVLDGEERRTRVKYYALNRLEEHLSVLLSVLARAGHAKDEHARLAFDHASKPLRVPNMAYRDPDSSTLEQLGVALDELAQTAAREKKQVIHACATCISADRIVTPNEAELFRAIADDLGVPTPPVLPGQKLV
ncbi:MAG: M48 family metallopeptidase [Planctomycetota bacterium]